MPRGECKISSYPHGDRADAYALQPFLVFGKGRSDDGRILVPRQSIEARSAAIFRPGGKRPPPPANLSDDAKKLWREIVEDRPIDYFRPGALYLLEQLCVMTVAARRVSAWLQERLGDEEGAALYLKYSHQCAMHCQKLRLFPGRTGVSRKCKAYLCPYSPS
jgi:hypothetical protein